MGPLVLADGFFPGVAIVASRCDHIWKGGRPIGSWRPRAFLVGSTSVSGPSGGGADGLLSAMSRPSASGKDCTIRACAASGEYANFHSERTKIPPTAQGRDL